MSLVLVSFLLILACGATLTIWSLDPRWERMWECSLVALSGGILLTRHRFWDWSFALPLLLLSAWGFAQLLVNHTVYRYATVDTALRYATYGALTAAMYAVSDGPAIGDCLLKGMACLGATVAVISVLAYYSSPAQILWMRSAPYPDVWGPFLSRNNFAQFLELCFPAALWLALRRESFGDDFRWLYGAAAICMFAAGLTSASRTGAILLCAETVGAAVWLGRSRWSTVGLLAVLGAGLAVLLGAGTLLERLLHSAWLEDRQQLLRSSWHMLRTRPLTGYGLGTYASVYPEFALFDSGYRIEHAHNEWLEWATEGGLPFAMIWTWIIARALRSLRLWNLGISAVAAHSLVDFPTARLGVSVWLFLLIGLTEEARWPNRNLQRRE